MKRNLNELLFTEEIDGPGDRLIALVIDFISLFLLFVFTIVAAAVLLLIIEYFNEELADQYSDTLTIVLLLTGLILFALYYSQIYQRDAQSLGEKIMRIRTIPLNGKRIGFCLAIHRLIVLFIPISWIYTALLAPNARQSIDDIRFNTITIKDRDRKSRG